MSRMYVPMCLSYMCLKLLFKMPLRKSHLFLMMNRHLRSSGSALLLWEEKEESSKFAILLCREAQPLGRAFSKQQFKCGCTLMGLDFNPSPICDTAAIDDGVSQGSDNIAQHQCDAHRCVFRYVGVANSSKKLCIRVRIEKGVQSANLGNIFRQQQTSL